MSSARRLLGSAALVTIANGVARLMAFAAAPLLTSTFGPGPFGRMALAYSAAALATIVALSGIDNSYMRFGSRGGNADGRARIERFCWRFAAVTTAALASAAVALIYLLSGTGVSFDQLVVVGGVGLAVLGVAKVMADTRRRLQGRFKRLASGMLVGGITTPVLAVTLGWYWRADAMALLVAALVGVLISVCIVGVPVKQSLLEPSGLDLRERRAIFAFGVPAMIIGGMFWVLGLSDRLILAMYVDQTTIGVYAFAASIATAGTIVNNAVGIAWFPEAVSTFEGNKAGAGLVLGRLWARVIVALLLVWLIVVAVGADVLWILADPRFHGGAVYIPLLAAGTFFSGVANLANTGLWLGKNMGSAAYAWVAGGVLAISLNLIVVPRMGGLGAAVTSSVCNGLVSAALIALAQRAYPLTLPWARLVASFILITVAGVVLSMWHPSTPLASVLLKMPLVAAIVLIAAVLISPDWVLRARHLGIARLRAVLRRVSPSR